jgi:acyl-CoA dehydrogenase
MARVKLTGKEKKKYLSMEPRPADVLCSIASHLDLPKTKSLYGQIDTVIAIARKFNDEVVRPVYKKIDLEVSRNHEYLCYDFIKEANEWGLFTLFIPKMFGGSGMDFMGIYPFVEEIASVCTGLSNVIGVHYLGIATLYASWNIKLMNMVSREVVKGEKTGKPCLITLAITEPGAGTDVEETILVDRGKVETIAKRVDGGFVVNGRKIFISNGHVSFWHMLICYTNKNKPSESTIMLAIHNGMKGFSFGHHEKKMGQKACVASELIFEDCFVPDELVCFDSNVLSDKLKKSKADIIQQVIDYVVSATRAGVAAFATGCARGAYETALEYSRGKTINGMPLINYQWVQSMLSEMYKNVNMGRAAYMEAAYANAMHGLSKIMFNPVLFSMSRFLPTWYFSIFITPFFKLKLMTGLFRKISLYDFPIQEAEASSGWASLVKIACSDIGIVNCQMAIELMGIDGCRHDIGAEKYLRDAKLLQIYEGTNQLNRINLFKNLVGRNMPGVKVFE